MDKPENSHVHEYIYINSKKIKMITIKVSDYKENIHRTANGQETDSDRTDKKIFKNSANNSDFYQEEMENWTADGQETDSGRTEFFIKQIEQKDAQIHALQQIIEKNQNLLDQQQRLALQDKKLLEEYKSEINELKSLKMPQEDKKENQSQEEVQTIKKQMEALNDKIKGQEQLIIKFLKNGINFGSEVIYGTNL
ncbi:RepB family protein [Lactococcus cremoris]